MQNQDSTATKLQALNHGAMSPGGQVRMWAGESCVNMLGACVCASFPQGPQGPGLKVSQVSRLLVKGTKALLVGWSLPTCIRKHPSALGAPSDPPLQHCELLTGRGWGQDLSQRRLRQIWGLYINV